MHTSEQVVELVEAAYEYGFSTGARNAYDTMAFVDGYAESSVGQTSDSDKCCDPYAGAENDSRDSAPEPDGTEYDAVYLEFVGQKVDDLLERVAGLEQWNYGTGHTVAVEEAADGRKCCCR